MALAIGRPSVHLVMPSGLGSGTPLIQHGAHAGADAPGAALVVECGQHFQQATADLATEVTLRLPGALRPDRRATGRAAPAPQRRFELLQTCM